MISNLTACPECDLVQREPACAGPSTVNCRRCGAVLYRSVPHGIDSTFALTTAAAILFVIANIFPVLSLDLRGQEISATLIGIARAFEEQGMTGIGVLVFLTLILVPGLEIAARLYILAPLRIGRVPRRMAIASRLLGYLKPWSMVEVFVLGAVVSLHRLGQIALLEIEPAFWAIAAVMLLVAATDSIFDLRSLWTHAARCAPPRGMT